MVKIPTDRASVVVSNPAQDNILSDPQIVVLCLDVIRLL